MHRWRLLLTRTAPECQVQAQHLTNLGIDSYCLPLLEITPLPETQAQRSLLLNIDRYTTLIAVSKHAAQLFIERLDNYWPQYPVAQNWFTVGQASASVLAKYGIHAQYPTVGDNSEALWALDSFQAALALAEQRVLIIKGQGGRPYLQKQLQQNNIPVDTIELYQRDLPNYAPAVCYHTILDNQLNGIVISSAQSLLNLQTLLGEHFKALTSLTFFVPSQRVADLAQNMGIKHIVNCQSANLKTLVLVLRQHQPICYNG